MPFRLIPKYPMLFNTQRNHQLRKAVGSVNGNKFRGGSDYQVALWNDCARIICNSIVYY